MFGVSSYWRNDLRGKFRCTKACSVAHHSCLNRRENCSLLEQLPPQTSSPQAAGLQPCQQPVPLRLSDSCPGWKPLPGGLPKRQGHTHLSHHPLRVGLDMKRKNMEKHVWQHLHEQYHLQTPGDCILSLWTGQGRGSEDSEEGGRPNSVPFSHSLWRSHVAVSMVPRKISHACFPSEPMDPKVKWRN